MGFANNIRSLIRRERAREVAVNSATLIVYPGADPVLKPALTLSRGTPRPRNPDVLSLKKARLACPVAILSVGRMSTYALKHTIDPEGILLNTTRMQNQAGTTNLDVIPAGFHQAASRA